MQGAGKLNSSLLLPRPFHLSTLPRAVRLCRCELSSVQPGSNGQAATKLGSQVQHLAAMVERAQTSMLTLTRERDIERETAAYWRAQYELERASRAGLEAEVQALRQQLTKVAGAMTRMPVENVPEDSSLQPEVEVDTILLQYKTDWNPAYIHYNLDGQGWTKPPGEPLRQTEDGVTAVAISGNSMEFVMTDGNGLWDKPELRHGSNYVIKRPGSYFLESGRLRAV